MGRSTGPDRLAPRGVSSARQRRARQAPRPFGGYLSIPTSNRDRLGGFTTTSFENGTPHFLLMSCVDWHFIFDVFELCIPHLSTRVLHVHVSRRVSGYMYDPVAREDAREVRARVHHTQVSAPSLSRVKPVKPSADRSLARRQLVRSKNERSGTNHELLVRAPLHACTGSV